MTVPNLLSLFRLFLVPVFVAVYFRGGKYAEFYAAAVYAIASLTDMLDGKIARKFNQVSRLGRVLDPLGDKMMTFAVLLCITLSKVIPAWAIVLFIVKEVAMLLGGMILFKKLNDMPPSNYFGKVSTVVFFIVCVLLMLFDFNKTTAVILISIALVVMLSAFASYIIRYFKIVRKRNGEDYENDNQ